MNPDDDVEEAAWLEDEAVRIANIQKTSPKRIWLQIDDEADQYDGWDAITWCSDQINASDVEYVRADQIRKAQVEVLREARDRMAVTNELNPLVFLDRMADELEGSKI